MKKQDKNCKECGKEITLSKKYPKLKICKNIGGKCKLAGKEEHD